MATTTTLTERYRQVTERLNQAAERAGRDTTAVNLLAVSKRKSRLMVAELADLGQRAFGENYLQEALPKIEALSNLNLEWHFIGRIQSNKTRDIARSFSWVHTIDRLKIAQRLSGQRPADFPPLNVCIEVNLSGESSKGGIGAGDVTQLVRKVEQLPGLRLRGLMTLPAPAEYPVEQAKPLRVLAILLNELNASGSTLDTLSMGTTHDFETAIVEGATIVRIGTALFGPRNT